MPRHDRPLTRVDLAILFRDRGCKAIAEIGVERGLYTEVLCRQNTEATVYAIDAWRPYPGYREHVTAEKLERFYGEAVERVRPYRCEVLRGWSERVVQDFAPQSLDAVYIDGNHQFSHVVADITAWAPKVKPGGIVAGHDFGRTSVGQVQQAVDGWCAEHGLDYYVLTGDKSPSWYWEAR